MADPSVVVVASAAAVTTLKVLPGVGKQIIVFADTEALRAGEAIATHKPNIIVFQREFLDTPRGAALVSQVKANPDLSHAQIRVPVRRRRVRASPVATLAGRTRSGHGGTR